MDQESVPKCRIVLHNSKSYSVAICFCKIIHVKNSFLSSNIFVGSRALLRLEGKELLSLL